jgi:hypothetical protein
MATFRVDGDDLVLRLRGREKVMGFHADIRAPLSSVRSVRVLTNPWLGELRGWRMAGIAIPPFFSYGTRRHGTGYDFAVVRRMQPVVEVQLSYGRFQRLLASAESAEEAASLAASVAAAAGIKVSEAG